MNRAKSNSFKPMRSALYLPASNERAIEKSRSIDADWIIFDLEDSVALQSKEPARNILISQFSPDEFGRSRTAIRCNAVGSVEYLLDLDLIALCRPHAVLLPKISNVSDVEQFAKDAKAHQFSEEMTSWFMIETAEGVAQIESIVRAGCNIPCALQTLVVGHNDLASLTGVSLAHDRRYLIPWLMQIVLQAKRFNIQVLDSVWNNYKDLDGFETEAVQAKEMGFDGKTLIHPSQVEPANRLFSPTEEEIARAKSVVDEFSKAENANLNVLSINGEMVERLHLDQAQRLLEKVV